MPGSYSPEPCYARHCIRRFERFVFGVVVRHRRRSVLISFFLLLFAFLSPPSYTFAHSFSGNQLLFSPPRVTVSNAVRIKFDRIPPPPWPRAIGGGVEGAGGRARERLTRSRRAINHRVVDVTGGRERCTTACRPTRTLAVHAAREPRNKSEVRSRPTIVKSLFSSVHTNWAPKEKALDF